ncbi:MAG: nucleoside hydrolase [Thermoanaerobaculia bacterium]
MQPSRRRVLVDTDPSMLTWGFEVDDDLALLFLLGSPEVEISAITTTYGNSLGALTHRDATRLLESCGRTEIPLARGAGFFSRDSRPTPASRLIVETVRRYPGEVTLLTLGPLTNLAAALAAWPALEDQAAGLVIMGGRSREGLSDFNVRADPASARRVLASRIPKVAITIDLCLTVCVTARWIDGLSSHPSSHPDSVVFPFAPTLRRFAHWQDRFRAMQGRVPEQATGGFHPWDAIAAAWLVDPTLFGDLRDVTLSIDAKGRSSLSERTERTERADVGLVERTRMPFTVDSGRFLALFAERLVRARLPPSTLV